VECRHCAVGGFLPRGRVDTVLLLDLPRQLSNLSNERKGERVVENMLQTQNKHRRGRVNDCHIGGAPRRAQRPRVCLFCFCNVFSTTLSLLYLIASRLKGSGLTPFCCSIYRVKFQPWERVRTQSGVVWYVHTHKTTDIYLSICLSVYLSSSQSIHLYICVCVCLNIYMYS